MVIAKRIIFVFACVTLFAVVDSRVENRCQTPNSQDGTCKKASECSSLHDLFLYSAISDEIVSYLRKSVCGYVGTHPKVCCPNGKLDLTISSFQQKKNLTVSLLKHDLLPNNKKCGIYAENRLFSGDKVAMDQYPWNVLLKYKTDDGTDGFYCAGVPISEKYVLTAAHCINGANLPKDTKPISVRFGEHDVSTDPDCEVWGNNTDCILPFRDIPIEETIVHEDYDPQDRNQYHDIALVRLKFRFLYNDFVQSLCLPGQTKDYSEGTLLEAAGWGIDSNKVTYTEKKRVEVAVKDSSVCEEAFRVKLNQNQLCFGVKGSKLCSRDSGGSLFDFSMNGKNINAYAAAIMSFGSCGAKDYPTVYTKVDGYTDWIVSKLRP